MKVTITKFIELPTVGYRLQKVAEVPGEIIQPGLILSGFTERPVVELIVSKVIYHLPCNGNSFSQEVPDVHLICESNPVSKVDPGEEWLRDNYGRDWDIRRLAHG